MIQDQKRILQEVLVKMFYDPKKTLSEQTSSVIMSPTGMGREGEVYKPVEKEGPSDELIKWREEYPSVGIPTKLLNIQNRETYQRKNL